MNQQFYSQDEVQQIIKRAATVQETDLVSAQQLAQIAAELGIAPEALGRAQEQWQAERSRRGRWRDRLRSPMGLRGHLWAYAGGSVLLWLNVHYSELNPTLGYIPCLWAVVLLCHAREAMAFHRDALKSSPQVTGITTAATDASARTSLQRP